jgi:cell wall-associated NlpC family hydrolase
MNWKKIEEELISLPEAEALARHKVLREAATWINTPYHENGDVKGAGVDCGMLLIRCFSDTGIIEPFDPRPYPIQWAYNQRAERYLEIVQRFASEIFEPPLPADVAMFKIGHSWSHGAIVTRWPEVIHANRVDCKEDNHQNNLVFSRMVPRFFRVKSWMKEAA